MNVVKFISIVWVVVMILVYAIAYLFVFVAAKKTADLYKDINNDCKDGELCEPQGYWEMIEQCKKCGKIL